MSQPTLLQGHESSGEAQRSAFLTGNDMDVFIAKFLNNIGYQKPKVPSVDPTKTYTEEEMAKLIKQLPDSSRFPLPESWYEKYGFTKAEPMSLHEVYKTSFQTMFAPSIGEVEERKPAEGGVRTIITHSIVENETDKVPKSQEEVAGSV